MIEGSLLLSAPIVFWRRVVAAARQPLYFIIAPFAFDLCCQSWYVHSALDVKNSVVVSIYVYPQLLMQN